MAKDVIMPALGMAQESGVLVRWLVQEGTSVAEGEPLMEVETDKAIVEVPAPASGTLSEVAHGEGDEVPVGTVLAVLLEEGEVVGGAAPAPAAPVGGARPSAAPAGAPTPARVTAAPSAPHPAPGKVLASPKAKRIARERGIALVSVTGSGPAGAVRAVDLAVVLASGAAPGAASGPAVESAVESAAAPAVESAPAAGAPPAAPQPAPAHGASPSQPAPAPRAARAGTRAAPAWCQATVGVEALLEFLARVNASRSAARLGLRWPVAVTPADVLARCLTTALARTAAPAEEDLAAGGLSVSVHPAAGAGATARLSAAALRSIHDIAIAREAAAATGGPTEAAAATGGPDWPALVVEDRSSQRFERSAGQLPPGASVRLVLGPVAEDVVVRGGAVSVRPAATLRLDYDAALDDERAAAVFGYVKDIVEDPFALAVQG